MRAIVAAFRQPARNDSTSAPTTSSSASIEIRRDEHLDVSAAEMLRETYV
jgi:hypothetical protein